MKLLYLLLFINPSILLAKDFMEIDIGKFFYVSHEDSEIAYKNKQYVNSFGFKKFVSYNTFLSLTFRNYGTSKIISNTGRFSIFVDQVTGLETFEVREKRFKKSMKNLSALIGYRKKYWKFEPYIGTGVSISKTNTDYLDLFLEDDVSSLKVTFEYVSTTNYSGLLSLGMMIKLIDHLNIGLSYNYYRKNLDYSNNGYSDYGVDISFVF